jgi:hypothetical protein
MTFTKLAQTIKHTSLAYKLLNATFSALGFMSAYFFWLKYVDFWIQFPLLVAACWVTGLVGSWIARVITTFNLFETNIQHGMQGVLIAVLYALLVWTGFIPWLLSWFDYTTTTGFIQTAVIFIILKFAITEGCDNWADNLTFKNKKQIGKGAK